MAQENQDAERRDRILRIAGKLFLEKGFAGTSMSDIVAAGAASKGTIYTHFRSKEELFLAFMTAEIRTRAAMTFDPLDDSGGLKKTLSVLGQRYVRVITHETVSALYRVVVGEGHRFTEIGRMFNEAGPQTAKAKLGGYLLGNIQAGKLKISDVHLAAEQFFMLCQAGIMQDFLFCLRGPPTDTEIEKIVGGAVAVFLAAYGTARSD